MNPPSYSQINTVHYILTTGVSAASEFSLFCQKRHGRVVRDARLWCRKSPEGHEFEPGLHHPATGKLSLSTKRVMGSSLGKDRQRWQRDGLRLPYTVPQIQWNEGRGMGFDFHILCPRLQSPLPLWLLGYGKPLPFF